MDLSNIQPRDLGTALSDTKWTRKEVANLWLSPEGRKHILSVLKEAIDGLDQYVIKHYYCSRRSGGSWTRTEKKLATYLSGCFSINKNLSKDEVDEYKVLVRLLLDPFVGNNLKFLKRISRMKNITRDIFDDEAIANRIGVLWEYLYYDRPLAILARKKIIDPPSIEKIISTFGSRDLLRSCSYYANIISCFLASIMYSKTQSQYQKAASSHIVKILPISNKHEMADIDTYLDGSMQIFLPLSKTATKNIMDLDFDVVSDLYELAKYLPALRSLTDKITDIGVAGHMPLPTTAFELAFDLLD